MKLVKTLLEIVFFPVVAAVLLAIALTAAALHLIAMPGLYLWEKRAESRPSRPREP